VQVKANRKGTIDFTCPQCGKKFTKTVGWIEANPQFPCEAECGFGFEAEGFVKKLDDSLSDIEGKFGDLKF